MAKSNCILRRTTNALLDLLAQETDLRTLPSESELARALNVSRTTAHAALRHIEERGVVARSGRRITLIQRPKAGDYFNDRQIMSPSNMIEQVLMERMRHGDWEPGHEFTETDLARLSGVSTASVREFLIGFSRFHMVERRPRGGWKLLGLQIEFAKEVAEMREMIELTAMRRLAMAANDLQCRQTARRLLDEHRVLLAQMPKKYKEFRALDREFHLWLISQLENRFATDFFDIVSFVFYYHYKWNANEELLRNTTALEEHIDILEYLLKKDTDLATQKLTNHLLNSRSMLISSLK